LWLVPPILLLVAAPLHAQAAGPRFVNPRGLSRPTGYTHVVLSPDGRTAYIAGQVAYDSTGAVVGGGSFEAQAARVFANLATALACVGATLRDVMKTTTYLTDLDN
jgi:enamine deaminase RidA (YjgF/YER057c/UK114 family)